MTNSLLTEVRGQVGVITLNRPQALNALNLEMIRVMSPQLDAWAKDDGIRAVVIRGAGEKAFCAGGDVRAIATALPAEAQEDPQRLSREFFRAEYSLNHRIHHFPKPYISLVDGICMGGGLGLSMHGSHRVVTERLGLAMPETAIGLFPDVGGGWFLPRFPGESGTYLGLTGTRCGAADAKWLGYATHSVPSSKVNELLDALTSARWSDRDPHEQASSICSSFTIELGDSALQQRSGLIDRTFAFDSVEEILSALERKQNEWAAETRSLLQKRCPFSLEVTLKQLRLGRTIAYDEMARVEYRLAQAVTARADFREGVRSVLVDKDQRPQWRPASLGEVSRAEVDACFAPIADELEFR